MGGLDDTAIFEIMVGIHVFFHVDGLPPNAGYESYDVLPHCRGEILPARQKKFSRMKTNHYESNI